MIGRFRSLKAKQGIQVNLGEGSLGREPRLESTDLPLVTRGESLVRTGHLADPCPGTKAADPAGCELLRLLQSN